MTNPEAVEALVERLGELLAKATPGPWERSFEGGSIRADRPYQSADGTCGTVRTRVVFGHDGAQETRDADFALIVEAVNTLPTLLAALSAAPVAATRELRIGDKVEVIGQYEADFRGQDWWVAGIRVHDSGEGLDVTLAEQWPIPNRNWREYRGQTDGFRPEELRAVAALSHASPTHVGEHLSVANAERVDAEMVMVPYAELKDFADVISNLIGELSDPGSGAMAAQYRINRMIQEHRLAASTPKDTGERGPVR